MATMFLKSGEKYDTAKLQFSHWQKGDDMAEDTEGYNVWDYFENDGTYKGADVDGIEPVFMSQSVLEL